MPLSLNLQTKSYSNKKFSTSSKCVSLKCFFPISVLLTLSYPFPSVSTNLNPGIAWLGSKKAAREEYQGKTIMIDLF